jgi:hypothetical protein
MFLFLTLLVLVLVTFNSVTIIMMAITIRMFIALVLIILSLNGQPIISFIITTTINLFSIFRYILIQAFQILIHWIFQI